MTADEKILALVKLGYMDRIPKMFRGHATKATLKKLPKSIQIFMPEHKKMGTFLRIWLKNCRASSMVSSKPR